MKKAIYSLFSVCLLTSSFSCSSDDNGGDSNQHITVQALTNTITNQSWRITYFSEDDFDETETFEGYDFTFSDNNTVVASDGADINEGVWSTSDNGDDDTPNSNPDLNILFDTDGEFSELNEDWYAIERTGNKVRLKHVSGGDGSTDYLTFERN